MIYINEGVAFLSLVSVKKKEYTNCLSLDSDSGVIPSPVFPFVPKSRGQCG